MIKIPSIARLHPPLNPLKKKLKKKKDEILNFFLVIHELTAWEAKKKT